MIPRTLFFILLLKIHSKVLISNEEDSLYLNYLITFYWTYKRADSIKSIPSSTMSYLDIPLENTMAKQKR